MNKMSDKKMSDPITQKDIQKEIEELNDNSKLVYHHGKHMIISFDDGDVVCLDCRGEDD